MKKTRSARRMQKMLIMVAALTLVLGVAIGGTVAYLVATAGAVTNTFTVGQIGITLKEHALKADGTLDTTWTDENTYHIVPGDTIQKDPTVTVNAGSEACFVFACVENQLVIGEKTVATPAIDTDNWTAVKTVGTKTMYAYTGTADKIVAYSNSDTKLAPVFKTVQFDSDLTEAEASLPTLEGKKIIINAYAHQSDNTDYATAEAAALKHFGLN